MHDFFLLSIVAHPAKVVHIGPRIDVNIDLNTRPSLWQLEGDTVTCITCVFVSVSESDSANHSSHFDSVHR